MGEALDTVRPVIPMHIEFRRWVPLWGALVLAGCSRETWVLDREVLLFRNSIACGFTAERNPRDATERRLGPGQQFTVYRREWVDGQACWGIRTPEGLDGWMTFAPGTAHRLR